MDLIRCSLKREVPQFGAVNVGSDYPRFFSLELPYADNQPNISCIPDGKYLCKRRVAEVTGGEETFEVMDVPGRSGILFHYGNTDSDTHGCILLGLGLGEVGFVPAILQSKKAWRKFMAYMYKVDQFELFIRHM